MEQNSRRPQAGAGRSRIDFCKQTDSTDKKRAVPFLTRIARNDFHMTNFRKERTTVTPERQLLKGVLASLRLQFHLAVAEIPDPSVESQPAGFGARAVSVAYALYPPVNEQPDTMDHGWSRRSFRRWRKPGLATAMAALLASMDTLVSTLEMAAGINFSRERSPESPIRRNT